VLGDLAGEMDLVALVIRVDANRVVDLGEVILGKLGVECGADDWEDIRAPEWLPAGDGRNR
jgi:hypothetical protein